ncbi:MAG: hypothetical protein RL685_2460 [Pseudomonadota bacterium]|jgi:hypothetical protein
MKSRFTPPSLGFCAIVLTYLLTASFFAWGLSTPPLDRVWQLHHQLKTGDVYALTAQDRELLVTSMERHPELAQALLSSGRVGIISAHRDGWIDTPEVSIVRAPRSVARRILLEIQTPPEHIPYRVQVKARDWQRTLEVKARGALTIELPPAPAVAELLTLKLEGAGLRADSSSLAVRIRFEPNEGASSSSGDEEDEGEEREAE